MQRIKKAKWPKEILHFPLGLDTYHTDDECPPTALRELVNAEGTVLGAWQTRRGRELFLTLPDPTKPVMGMYELYLNNGTTHLLLSQAGRLYKESAGVLSEILIRKYRPYPPFPEQTIGVTKVGELLEGVPLEGAKIRVSGSVGVNLVANRWYRYTVHGVDAAGTTPIADVTATMIVKQLVTAYPVDLNWHGCFGVNSYVIWRSESTDNGVTWSAWGQMATGVTHVTVGGKTLVRWTDDGAVAPNTSVAPPLINTTAHLLPDDVRVDWETFDGSWDGENAVYFCAGNGYCRTNGTEAEIVPPTDPSTYFEGSDAGPGINALGDVTWPGHQTKGLIRHHAYMFLGDLDGAQNVFYWSRALDPCHMPQLAAIPVPARGGRVLDFRVKDSQLAIGCTTGIWTLYGTIFDPLGPSADVYFSEATDIGVASEWSMVRSDAGLLQFVANDKRLRGIAHLLPDKERVTPFEVAEAIRPTLSDLTDHTDAVGLWAEDQWFLAYPDDQQMLRIYQRQTSNGSIVAPVIDTGTALGNILRRRDGTLLGAHATMGYVYTLLTNGVYTDGGNPYTFRIQTAKLDGGDARRNKKWRECRVYYQCVRQVTLNYRLETREGVIEDAVVLAGTGGYDEALYDSATYDPWSSPYEALDFGEEGEQIQVTLWCDDGFLRITGLLFELDYKR